MAEEGRVYELEGLEEQLHTLLSRYSGEELGADGGPFCSDFCKLVQEFASRWQVPLPQLRILEIALCCFARASIFCTSNCDHVLHTLSSLALSVFELLLFFDQKDFHQEPLKHFTVTFQECHVALAKHENVHLLQVERLVRGGGPWANPALQAILSESSLPQNEVDGCIGSELPVFFELRVRYLLSCKRTSEAVALAQCCARHPTAGQHSFFLQVYLTWLYKTSQHDRLVKEVGGATVADLSGEDAVHLICSLECEEKDELLLGLSTAFLLQQLRRGDMYYLCELVFVWTKLHSRLKTSKQALLKESHQLMLSATNVNSLFPFIRAILQEMGEDGVQFCVELCANALDSCLPCDVLTKSLIYKTIAGLLPNDLEVCRACALLVFFLERTVESYKVVYLLYMHPDQEYHVEHSPIGNHVRFETLQVLKKDLYFDPEFWNLIALRTNCLKLMSEKVVSAALEEIMDDKWISTYFAKEPALRSRASVCQRGSKSALQGKKTRTTAICSVQEQEATDVQGKKVKDRNQDIDLDIPENSELMETAPESEESKLEYCCTFCNKAFKGSRVVAHAMFHYRKDECMFCGTMFKDDLLAMMHLSDHIEKLKRIKESTDNQAQDNGISDAKDISTPKTSAKGLSLQETQNGSKHLNSKAAVHKVNGHIGNKKEFDRSKKALQQEASQGKARDGAVNPRLQQKIEIDSSATSVQGKKKFASSTEEKIKETESLQALKAATKQNGKVIEEKNVEPQEKVCCPADGCSWFTDLSKNRVALLYHALEDHHGEVKPLELAFRVGNSRCSICMRVLWSFEHFQHHVERHRLAPRHPCLHQGCTSRFKSGMEMRRHARKHSPLQAVCCLPGCSKLFICLWALNLHEREHYASKSTKSDTNTNVQTSDKHITMPFGKKHHQSSNDTHSATAVNKTENVKATWKSREQTTHDLQGGKHPKAPPLSTPASLIKQELKERNKTETQTAISGPGYSVIMNGQASSGDGKSTVREALAQYSKKPYMRLPPTAYLDEKYITMPKRRKEMLFFQPSQRSAAPEQAYVMAAPQRQRCANCFATFNTAEELQSHLQLQKCSNLFGFDSDDEGKLTN
uniref:C2H2-type domain-containing protein n=1 Tax=Amphiprion ocellaris TaxID=80972 RepID=A0AAQ5XQ78_AMPOC